MSNTYANAVISRHRTYTQRAYSQHSHCEFQAPCTTIIIITNLQNGLLERNRRKKTKREEKGDTKAPTHACIHPSTRTRPPARLLPEQRNRNRNSLASCSSNAIKVHGRCGTFHSIPIRYYGCGCSSPSTLGCVMDGWMEWGGDMGRVRRGPRILATHQTKQGKGTTLC